MKKEIFSGTFFLVISILLTAAACVSIMDGAPNVFAILFSVSAWLAYGSSKADEEWVRGLGLGCGTAKALFIVNWVCVGLLAVSGIVIMFFYRTLAAYFMNGLYYGYGGGMSKFGNELGVLFNLFQNIGSVGFVWFGLGILLCAVVTGVINLLFVRSLMIFLRSLRDSNSSGEWNIEKAEGVYRWMFVLGILVSVGVLYVFKDGLAAFVSGCTGAAMIVASRWIKYAVLPVGVEAGFEPESEWYSSEQ
jgi:hypothetical protein